MTIIGLAILFIGWLILKFGYHYLSSYLTFSSNLFAFDASDYQYFNPPIFFSIGEAIATVAILLAVYQFRKEKWEIALEVRRYIRSVVVVSLVAGFVVIIFSSIVSFWQPTNIFLLSVFWQVFAALLIIFAIVFLFLKTTNRNLFTPKNKDRFIGSLLRRVLSRLPQQIDLVVDTLGSNWKTILKEIRTAQRGDDISEFTKSAHFVTTQIISNPNFAHHIVTTRADFFQMFLRSISENHLYNDQSISVAFGSLMKASFLNRESYFYNEWRHSDPGVYYRPFLEDVFFDQNIFLNLRPLDQIGFDIGESISPEKLSLFLMALETALEGYFNEKRTINFEYSHYRQAFEHVENALSRVMDEARHNESQSDWPIESKLHQITFFAGWTFQRLYREAVKNNKVSQNDLDAPVEEKSYGLYPQSLTAGYAELLFKLLCILSEYPKRDAIRHYAMSLTNHILIFNEPEFSSIRTALLKYIWEKVNGEHMSNINGYYPAVLPVFLSLIGMWQDGATTERKALYNQTVEFLNNELRPKILANAKMANDDLMEERLLPPEVAFNREKNIFEWKMHKGTQEMRVRRG